MLLTLKFRFDVVYMLKTENPLLLTIQKYINREAKINANI